MVIAMLTTTSMALIAGEDVDNEKNAVWGSQMRDYICDEDNVPIQTSQGVNSFKLKVDDKEGHIGTVKLIEVSKGPSGESVKYSGDKFIAVEITLGTPRTPEKDEFEVYYTVTCRRDIKNGDDERLLDKGDEMSGSWTGIGRYVTKTVSTSVSVTENAEYTAYDSADSDVKTIIKFGSGAAVAANWVTSEDPKYLNFTTDLDDADLDKDLKLKHGSQMKYMRFKGTPSWRYPVRLVLLDSKDKYAYTKESGKWKLIDPCWYDSYLKGYVSETNEITEYLTTSVRITEDGKEYVEPRVEVQVQEPKQEEEETPNVLYEINEANVPKSIPEPEPEPELKIESEPEAEPESELEQKEPEQKEPIVIKEPEEKETLDVQKYVDDINQDLKESEEELQARPSWWQKVLGFFK